MRAKYEAHMMMSPWQVKRMLLPSLNLRAMNLRHSSRSKTGREIFSTATHSTESKGVTWKTVLMISTYRRTKCSDMDRAMADSSSGLIQGGITNSDWFSDKLFMAFNISMVTSTDRAMVMG